MTRLSTMVVAIVSVGAAGVLVPGSRPMVWAYAQDGFIAVPSRGAPPPPPPPPGVRDVGPTRTQQIPIGTAMVTGVVVSADSGRPVRHARLTLTGAMTTAVTPAVATPQAPTVQVVQTANGVVTITNGTASGVARTILSDEEGRFAFESLPAGRFTIDVMREQFLNVSYGQKKLGRPGAPIELGDGQRVDVRIPMIRAAAISGTVVDESGDPLQYARVNVLRYVYQNGFKRLRTQNGVQTDDRGMYRVFGLEPGDYLVSVVPNPSTATEADQIKRQNDLLNQALAAQRAGTRPSVLTLPMPAAPREPVMYAPTFFPSAATAGGASVISVGAGDETSNIDLRVLPIRTGTIEGTVVGPATPNTRIQVLLQNMDPASEENRPTTNAAPDGTFRLAGIPPGQYYVWAQTVSTTTQPNLANGPIAGAPTNAGPRMTPDDPSLRLTGREVVTVDGQSPAVVAVLLRQGRSVSGRVVFEMAQPPDRNRTTTIISITPAPQPLLLPAFNTSPQVPLDASGNFTLAGLRPGRYLLRASGPGTLKSVMLNGEDALDFPFELTADRDVEGIVMTLTDRVTELSGTLTDGTGKPTMDCTIVVAPADTRMWTPGARRIQVTRPSIEGKYSFRGLPAGDYLLAAVTDLETGGQFDPEFLKALSGASVRVRLADGAKQSQDLRVGQ